MPYYDDYNNDSWDFYFDDSYENNQFDLSKALKQTYKKEPKSSLLEKAAWVLQLPQNLMSHLMLGKNPLGIFKEQLYPSDVFGLKGAVGLGADIGIDPIWWLGSLGAGNKLLKLGTTAKKLSSLVDIDKLSQMFKAGKAFKTMDEFVEVAPKFVRGVSDVAKQENKLKLIEKFSKMLKSGEEIAPETIKTIRTDFAKGLKKIDEVSAKRIGLITKPELYQTGKEVAKWFEKYKGNTIKKAIKFKEVADKTTPGLTERLIKTLGGEDINDINKVLDIHAKTGKLPLELTYPERVREGIAGVGYKIPLTKKGFKTIAPNLQGSIAGNIQKALGGDFLRRLGVSADAIEKWKGGMSKYLDPRKKFIKEIDKAAKLFEQGRGGEHEYSLLIDFYGKVNTAQTTKLAEFAATGGVADESLIKNIKLLFPSDQSILKMTAGTDYLGISRMAGEIAKKFGVSEKEVGKGILQVLEKPRYSRDIKSFAKLPIWEKAGLDEAMVGKITKELSDPKYQNAIKIYKGVFDKVWDTEINKIIPTFKGIKTTELLSDGYVKNYVFHSMTDKAMKFYGDEQKVTKFTKGMLDVLNKSMKNRKLFRLSDNMTDAIIESFRTGGDDLSKIVESIGEGLGAKDYEKLKNIVKKSMAKVKRSKVLDEPIAKGRMLVDEIGFRLMGEKADSKLFKTIVENKGMEMMSIPEVNALARRTGFSKMIGGDLFRTNVAEITKKRMDRLFQTYGKYYFTKKMGDDLVAHGLAKHFVEGQKLPQGYIRGKYGKFKNYVIKKEVSPLIDDLIKYQFAQGKAIAKAKQTGAWNTLLKAHQLLIRNWKKLTTSPFMSFHTRNTLGNFWLMHQMGVPATDILKMVLPNKLTGNKLKGLNGVINRLGADIFKTGEINVSSLRKIVSSKGRVYLPEELHALITAGDMTQSGFYFSEVFDKHKLRGFAKELKDVKPLRAFGNISTSVEGSAKIGTFLWALKKGYEPVDALKFAHKTLFDYSRIPQLIQKARDNVFPFISWYYFNIPRQLEMLAKKPQILSAIVKLRQKTRDSALGEYKGYEGEFARDRFSVYFPKNPFVGTGLNYLLGKNGFMGDTVQTSLEGVLPLLDLNKLDNIPKELVSLFSPTFSIPLQNIFNKIPALGNQPVENYKGETVVKLGRPWKRKTWNNLKQALRLADYVDRLNPGGIFGTSDKKSISGYIQTSKHIGDLSTLSRIISAITGFKVYNTSITSGIWNEKIRLRDAIGKLKSELRRMSTSPDADKLRNQKLIQLNELKMKLKAADEKLEQYQREQESGLR